MPGDYISGLMAEVAEAIFQLESFIADISDNLENYVKGLADLDRRSGSPYSITSWQENPVSWGHTHYGPQMVWLGERYRVEKVYFEGTYTDILILPIVWKAGRFIDSSYNNYIMIDSLNTDKTENITSTPRTAKIDVRFIVHNAVAANTYKITRLSEASDPTSETGYDEGKITEIVQNIRDGVGMWMGPKYIKELADLYEIQKFAEIAASYPEMFLLDFGIKPGDILD